MEKKNGCLYKRLFDKPLREKSEFTQGFAQHITLEENFDALSKEK